MIANCKNGISSYEIHRAIGITQKSAWFVLHHIRTAMHVGSIEKLFGVVEADETYIGGEAKNMHHANRERFAMKRGRRDHKTGVLGLVERKGRVRARVIENAKGSTLVPIVRENVAKGTTLYTDQHDGYEMLASDYVHNAINHSIKHVEGNTHTNGIENFWSLLKRTVKGTYVSVSPQHLQKYVEEQTFRFNERKGNDQSRFLSLLDNVSGKRLTYAELTDHAA